MDGYRVPAARLALEGRRPRVAMNPEHVAGTGLRDASAQSRLYTGIIFPGAVHGLALGSAVDLGRDAGGLALARRNAGRGGTGGGGEAMEGQGGGERLLGCWRLGWREIKRGRAVGRVLDRADPESVMECDGSLDEAWRAKRELLASESSQRRVARAFASTRSRERDALRVFGLCTSGTPRWRSEMAGESGRSWRCLLGGEGSGVGRRSGDGARGGRGDELRGYICG